MSDSTHSLKIQVVTSADTSALKEASDALKQTSEAAGKIAQAAPPKIMLAGLVDKLAESVIECLAGTVIQRMTGKVRELANGGPARAEDALPKNAASPPSTASGVTTSAPAQPPADSDFNEPGTFRVEDGNVGPGSLPASRDPSVQRVEAFVRSLMVGQLEDAGKAAEALERGAKIDADQRAMMNSLNSLLSVTHASTKEILVIIADGHKGQAGLRREIDELKRAVAEVARRSANPINPGPP
jgi:hypothetical protein